MMGSIGGHCMITKYKYQTEIYGVRLCVQRSSLIGDMVAPLFVEIMKHADVRSPMHV